MPAYHILDENKELMAIKVADYIIENNATIREVCDKYVLLTSRTAMNLLKLTKEFDSERYEKAMAILEEKQKKRTSRIKHENGYELIKPLSDFEIKRANEVADYIIENHATLTDTATRFNYSMRHIHTIINCHLNNTNIEKYKKVKEIMKENQFKGANA